VEDGLLQSYLFVFTPPSHNEDVADGGFEQHAHSTGFRRKRERFGVSRLIRRWPAACHSSVGKMRPTPLAALVLFALVVTAPAAARASTPGDGADFHLRTTQSRLRALLEDGVRQSPAFRALVERLSGSDVVVYLHTDSHWPAHADGAMTFVTAAGGYRYVVVRVREQRSRSHMLALLAHELRHAVEVAETPAIVDADSMAREYSRFGYARPHAVNGGVAFDTDAAVEAGYQVLAELEASRQRRGRRTLAVNAAVRNRFGAGTEMSP
jgi:hypothetical protein